MAGPARTMATPAPATSAMARAPASIQSSRTGPAAARIWSVSIGFAAPRATPAAALAATAYAVLGRKTSARRTTSRAAHPRTSASNRVVSKASCVLTRMSAAPAATAARANAVVAQTTSARLATRSAADPRMCAEGTAVVVPMRSARTSAANRSSARKATGVRRSSRRAGTLIRSSGLVPGADVETNLTAPCRRRPGGIVATGSDPMSRRRAPNRMQPDPMGGQPVAVVLSPHLARRARSRVLP